LIKIIFVSRCEETKMAYVISHNKLWKNSPSDRQTGRQAGRVASSSQRKSFNISISNSISFTVKVIYIITIILSLSYLWASEVTKPDAWTCLSKCSTVPARISQKKEKKNEWKIYRVRDAIALAIARFWSRCFVRWKFRSRTA